MNGNQVPNDVSALHGNLLRLGERHEIAIYLRDGMLWVADFYGSHGKISTAGAWFAVNHARWALRRAAPDSVPIPTAVAERIQRLHDRVERQNDAPRTLRALADLAAKLRAWAVRGCFARLTRRSAQPLGSARRSWFPASEKHPRHPIGIRPDTGSCCARS